MSFRWNQPNNEDDFEEFCLRFLRCHWGNPDLQLYAHRGEAQCGVDIFDPMYNKPFKAAQCKHKEPHKTITPNEIQGEVDKARVFDHPLDQYIILTTAKKSASADKKIVAINELHIQQTLFPVKLYYWSTIEEYLDLKEYAEIAQALIPSGWITNFHRTLFADFAKITKQLIESLPTSPDSTSIDWQESFRKRVLAVGCWAFATILLLAALAVFAHILDRDRQKRSSPPMLSPTGFDEKISRLEGLLGSLERKLDSSPTASVSRQIEIPNAPTEPKTKVDVPRQGLLALTSGGPSLCVSKRFFDGAVLRVVFLDGDQSLRDRVAQVAREWSVYSNLVFDFSGDDDAGRGLTIRITFREPFDASYLGTDAGFAKDGEPTMWLGSLTKRPSESWFRRTVLFHFGLALGLIPSLNRPDRPFVWNEAALQEHFGAPPYKMSIEDIRSRFIQTRDYHDLLSSRFGLDSIMMSPLPHGLANYQDGAPLRVGVNSRLSLTDKQFIAWAFVHEPDTLIRPSPGPVELSLRRGQVGRFRFQVGEGNRRCLLRLDPREDLEMAIFGPEDSVKPLAALSDGGEPEWTERIEEEMTPGVYFLRVRFRDPVKSGNYSLRLELH
jgi:hypothetical protein